MSYNSPSQSRVHSGLYTGDGNATRAITGVGFKPKGVHIYEDDTALFKADAMRVENAVKAFYRDGSGTMVQNTDTIVSFDGDGFTVGDGTGASNTMNIINSRYAYIAWG